MNTIALVVALSAIAVAVIPRESVRIPWRRPPEVPMMKVRLGLKPVEGVEQATIEGYTHELRAPLIMLVDASTLQPADGPAGSVTRTSMAGRVFVPYSNLLFGQVLNE